MSWRVLILLGSRTYAVRAGVALEKAQSEGMTAEYACTAKVLPAAVEYSDLGQLGSRVAVTGAQLTLLVVTPAVEVALGIDHVPKVLAYRELSQLQVLRQRVSELNKWLGVALIPGKDPAVVSHCSNVGPFGSDGLDGLEVEAGEVAIFVLHEGTSSLRKGYDALRATL